MKKRIARRAAQKILASALVLTTAAGLAACSSAGANEKKAVATESTARVPQTTTGPEPITTAEQEWLRGLSKLQKRLEKTAFQGGVVTRDRLLSEAKAYDRCKKSLGAQPSERFQDPYDKARNACRGFHRAAAQLRIAAANADASGAVIAGTQEQRNFNRALERGTTYAGNSVNRMSSAVAKAEAIKDALPT
jgi:hypothetical protein